MTEAPRRVSNLNWANVATVLRVALVPLFAWLLVVRRPPLPWLAAAIFAVAMASDSVDGWLARRLDLVTGFGQFLDPLADKLIVGTALVALALDGRVPWWAVVVILAREVAVQVGLRVVLARSGRALPASPLGKAKTVVQIAAVIALTATPAGNVVANLILAAAIVLTLVSGYQYFHDALRGRAGVPWR